MICEKCGTEAEHLIKKKCRRCYRHEYNQKPENKAKARIYSKSARGKKAQLKYRENHREKLNLNNKLWMQKHPDRVRAYKKKQHEKENQLGAKRQAWRFDYKKKDKECAYCGATEHLEYHHVNYALHRGYTLCVKCHKALHKRENKRRQNVRKK